MQHQLEMRQYRAVHGLVNIEIIHGYMAFFWLVRNVFV